MGFGLDRVNRRVSQQKELHRGLQIGWVGVGVPGHEQLPRFERRSPKRGAVKDGGYEELTHEVGLPLAG